MDAAIRDHLARALAWEDAHVGIDKALAGIPADKRGARPPGFEHSLWHQLEHIRIAQEDILDFCVKPKYEHTMKWPDDYWPAAPAPPDGKAWDESLAAYVRDRKTLERLARETPDLTALVPTGKGTQTYLRALLLVIDHAAYHVGQIVELRRALGIWP
ncbi:MAG TPA: DinB family protein [Vicinamibacterales bacterium]|nr:DinB family protein [Vicinamibacterales bacterium]